MKAKLIVQNSEVVIRGYSLIEEEGIRAVLSNYPKLSSEYEEDEENQGRHMLVVRAQEIQDLFKFFEFIEIPLHIIS